MSGSLKPILDTVLRGGGIAAKQTLIVQIIDEHYQQPLEPIVDSYGNPIDKSDEFYFNLNSQTDKN